MNSSNVMSFKAKINNYAKKHKIAAQVVLQNFMFERFLQRLSMSKYRDKFLIKGGILVASIVCLDTRSTMDLDTTLRGLPLTEEMIKEAIHSIISMELNDNVDFEMISIAPIRDNDLYGGFRSRINAHYYSIDTPLSIDISTGDVMTPDAVQYQFNCVFEDDVFFNLWAYNLETILAEKIESILTLGVLSTRPKDYYDIYILTNTKNYDKKVFLEALQATAAHRGTSKVLIDKEIILKQIVQSKALEEMWNKYRKKFEYAKSIEYSQVMDALRNIVG